ncbi:hypothetical protein [Aminobacter sp. BE322]|uniref:hypothetical protein n=1 Tax=unclassified Aminobacter TaxID=2644704 RepID=UPI003D23011C
MPETTPGSALMVASNGHVTRGGEFEKRPAFVPEYTLPAGTVGMWYDRNSIVVFGHAATPAGMPTGVAYQRLQHPDNVTALVRVHSADLYAGKIYAVGEFADGSIHHFYDGVRIEDWYDGRARAAFIVTGGTSSPLSAMTNIKVNGVSIIAAAVNWTGDSQSMAAAIAAAINSHTSTPDYSATAVGAQVNISAVTEGDGSNGYAVDFTLSNGLTVSPSAGLALNNGSSELGEKASGSFKVGYGISGNSKATGSYTHSGNTSSNSSIMVAINGVNLMSAAVTFTAATSPTDAASAVATAINNHNSVPNYTATASAGTVTIKTSDDTAAVNGLSPTFTKTGTVPTGAVNPMAGGSAGTAGTVLPKLNGVNLTAAAVTWATSETSTAAAIAAAINSHTSTPDYTATSLGAVVTVTTVDRTSAVNGMSMTFTITAVLPITENKPMSGGGLDNLFQPGLFVKTIGSKMNSVSGPNFHFSGIKAPTKWTTDAVGAGFIDMSTEASGSETLVALAKYQQQIAIFAERVTQIWYVDPDPALNRQTQVLNNTGTLSPRSVTQFGDNDIFYLDESGLRSLRARDSSNAASTTDIGVPVDTLVIDKLSQISVDDRRDIIGIIEPRDGRFWLAIKDVIFVFSFFNGAQVSAWSTYTPSVIVAGAPVVFDVEDMAVFRRRVYIRSGNTIYVFGGLADEQVFDATVAEAWTPYLDADDPTRTKTFTGVDAALTGDWSIAAAFAPTDTVAEDAVAVLTETSFGHDAVSSIGESTHVSLRFRTTGAGPAKLSAAVIHYQGDKDED